MKNAERYVSKQGYLPFKGQVTEQTTVKCANRLLHMKSRDNNHDMIDKKCIICVKETLTCSSVQSSPAFSVCFKMSCNKTVI